MMQMFPLITVILWVLLQVKSLTEDCSNKKTSIDSLKQRLNVATKEKAQYEQMNRKAKEELEKKVHGYRLFWIKHRIFNFYLTFSCTVFITKRKRVVRSATLHFHSTHHGISVVFILLDLEPLQDTNVMAKCIFEDELNESQYDVL